MKIDVSVIELKKESKNALCVTRGLACLHNSNLVGQYFKIPSY
jgi:hypothetical protein